MKPSSGDSPPAASMSRSDSSREVSRSASSRSTPCGRSPVRSTSTPPCGAISFGRVVIPITLPSTATGQTSPAERAQHVSRTSCGDFGGNDAQLFEPREHDPRALLGIVLLRVDHDLGVGRLLVGIRFAGELLDLALERLLVETLDVTAGALVDGRLHV